MQKSKYLSSGEKLGGHYEIVKVLGEDNFEILYLVKDKHLGEKLFVLKELFLKELSLRDEESSVYTPAKSKYIFEETKKEVILETKKLQEHGHNGIERYGYFEENNTVYIIMEFLNDVKIEDYLETKLVKHEETVEEQEEKKETPLASVEDINLEDIKSTESGKKENSSKSYLFLKILIVMLVLFAGLVYYAYKIIQEDKAKSQDEPPTATVVVIPHTPKPMNHPTLTTRDKSSTEVSKNIEKIDKNESGTLNLTPDGAAFVLPMDEVYMEKNNSKLEGVPEAEIYTDVETIPQEVAQPIDSFTPVDAFVSKENFQPKESFTRVSIKRFLDKFTTSLSQGSVASILSHYDHDVQRYFLSNSVTHSDIAKERESYNNRWKDRDFKIENFVILRMYQQEGIEYCNIASNIKWSVSTENRGADFGKSRGLITLKNSPNGFKIVSIHSKK